MLVDQDDPTRNFLQIYCATQEQVKLMKEILDDWYVTFKMGEMRGWMVLAPCRDRAHAEAIVDEFVEKKIANEDRDPISFLELLGFFTISTTILFRHWINWMTDGGRAS